MAIKIDCWRGVLVHTIFVLAQPTYLAVRYFLNPEYFNLASKSWLAITFISWIWIVTRLSVPFLTSPLRHLPSPPTDVFPWGHFKLESEMPTTVFEDMLNDTPNDGAIVLWGPFYIGSQVIPTRPDTLADMLNTNNYDWEKPGISKKFLSRVLGEGLINTEGDQHKAMRKVIAPAFSGRNIRDLVPAFYAKGVAAANAMAHGSKQTGGVVEIMAQMSRVTLDVIGATGVGKDFNTVENDDNVLAKLYATITDTDHGYLLLSFLLRALIPPHIGKRLGNTRLARISRATIQLREEARALIREKKQLMVEKSEQQKDIIATIMRSGEYPDDYLVDQLLTFLAAGHDTTASALTWTFWLLSKHPECQDRLRAECTAHLADKSPSDVDATIFDAETTPYLHAVCNEVLRVYPTVPATERDSVRPTRLGPYVIPTGTNGVVSLWGINRGRAFWGPDANKWNPDRWLEGPNAANGGAVANSPYTVMTFLHGPRSCIGQAFARTEMKCLLAALILRFRFEMADPDEEVQVGGFVTIKPKNGLWMRLHDLQGQDGSAVGGKA